MIEALEKLHFKPENGLVFCDNPKSEHIGELYHIHEKARKLDVTAVLFRRKYNENNDVIDSKPVVYICQKENDFFNSQEHKDLHAKIWSAGDIEVYFFISKTEIHIFNARKPADVTDEKGLSLDKLRLVGESLEQFSAIIFAKGIFWEQEDFSDQLDEKDSPFHRLLEYLMTVRDHLYKNQDILSTTTIDKLLIICILVKFLEEIRDDNGKHTLRTIYRKYRVKNFAEALSKRRCISVLDDLAGEFKGESNGSIFDNFEYDEKQQIEKADLKIVADFLTAKLDITKKHKQRFLWEQYSFNHLPVELISSIYENFLQTEKDIREKGVVYTPPFLVNFLVDEVMPLDKDAANKYFSEKKFKVLDPSCGSGVFLVAAYKRMLQWWSINNYNKTDEIKFPTSKVCQEILENNIFGVDIEKTATLITIFSLTIALLDKLEPKAIWTNLKLNNLQNNIKHDDFFKWAADAKTEGKKFDLVIGNPPFNPKSGIKPKDAVSEAQIQLFGISNKDIPDNNFALKFFEGAMFFGKKVCLILPSSILLYNKLKTANKYRNRIFTKFTVEKIFDFTHLREILFVKKNTPKKTGRTPVCAVLSNPKESNGQAIEHTVVKRLVSSENKICFEIDHYDRHFVRHDWAIDETKQFIWKTNLLGGGRLFHLIYRLSLLENLNDFIEDRWKKNNEWIFQDGYKNILEKSERTIAYIYNHDKVSIIEHGDIISYEKEIHKDFGRPRPENLYKLPLLVIHKKIGDGYLPVGIKEIHSDDYLVFNSSFIGIHAPKEDFPILKGIYNLLKQHATIYLLWILSTSPNAMIGQETAIKKTDLDTLPFPENEEYLEFSETEKILQDDVLEYYIHLGKAITEKGAGRNLHEKVSEGQLESFGKTFCDVLNPIYAKNGKSWQCGKFYQTKSFTICQFGYGKNQGLSFQMLDDLDEVVKPLIYDNNSNRGAIFTRVCRYYKHMSGYDCVFLIKPNATRYWLNSIALRDADETFMDLRKAGR